MYISKVKDRLMNLKNLISENKSMSERCAFCDNHGVTTIYLDDPENSDVFIVTCHEISCLLKGMAQRK